MLEAEASSNSLGPRLVEPESEASRVDEHHEVDEDDMFIDFDSESAMAGLLQEPRPPSEPYCPITDADERPFPLMDFPAEIRNEIYRACLTRPFNILLSKLEPPPPEREPRDVDGASDLTQASSDTELDDDEDDEAVPSDELAALHARTGLSFQHPGNPSARGSSAGQASGSNSQSQTSSVRPWASRGSRPIRLLTSRSSSAAPATAGASTSANAGVAFRRNAPRSTRPASARTKIEVPRAPRPQDEDPLIVNLLRVSKVVYQEARSILYSENLFTLDLDTALPTLAALHQRSRRQIKHVEIEIPCYNEILERFQETVRLSLRYCWGLKQFVIHMPFTLPGADGSGTTGNTTVYANGFDILRWLPRQCEVVLKGNVCAEIEAVVSKNANLAKTLDEVRFHSRQNFNVP